MYPSLGTPALLHEKFWTVMPVLILHCCMLFGLVLAEMEVGVKFLEILQAEFEPACKHSGAQLGVLLSRHAKSL